MVSRSRPAARRPGTRTPGRAALAVRGDCQKITCRPRTRVNTSWERFSRPRLASLYEERWFVRILGLIVIAFALGAALAPPFSGLDTLPALGAVIVALSIILSDVLLLVIGLVIGTGGVILIVTVGATLLRLIKDAL